jgi:undecaprenyl-diphosphatase
MGATFRSFLEPTTEGQPDAGPRHPFRSALVITVIGYVVLTAVMIGIGLLLTHTFAGSVGNWDRHVSKHLARHRTSTWNDVTKVATSAVNTLPVIVGAAIVDAVLALFRRWREAAFLAIALVLEITVFLSVNYVVDRPRPHVPRLNSTPSTSSFPSGHTAAAVVLFVGTALIVTCCTRNNVARVLSVIIASAVAVTVAFARVYRGLHYPTDVFAGALYGLLCLTIAALAVRAAGRRAGSVRKTA